MPTSPSRARILRSRPLGALALAIALADNRYGRLDPAELCFHGSQMVPAI